MLQLHTTNDKIISPFCPISCNTWCVEIFKLKEIFMFVAYGFISHSSTQSLASHSCHTSHHTASSYRLNILLVGSTIRFCSSLLCNIKRAWLRLSYYTRFSPLCLKSEVSRLETRERSKREYGWGKKKKTHGFVDSLRQVEKYDYEHMSSEMQIDTEWTTSSDEEHSSLMSFFLWGTFTH